MYSLLKKYSCNFTSILLSTFWTAQLIRLTLFSTREHRDLVIPTHQEFEIVCLNILQSSIFVLPYTLANFLHKTSSLFRVKAICLHLLTTRQTTFTKVHTSTAVRCITGLMPLGTRNREPFIGGAKGKSAPSSYGIKTRGH